MVFFRVYLISCICFLCFSCVDKKETWKNGKTGHPDNTVVFQGSKIMMTVEEFDIDEKFHKKELSFEIVDHIYHPKNEAYCLYILKDKTGRYSAFPEFKIDARTRKFDVNTAKAQLDTKEELLRELHKKIPIYDVAGVDSGEVFYSFFGQVKFADDTFARQSE
jgi:hypothetical protein